jgi:UDP-GlcNAc:undecaprenyl-phosphate GlcNAc-1-phosphate transferase
MIFNFLVIIIFIITNFIIYKKIDPIIKYINIFDKPSRLKIHKKKVSLAGGTIICFNLIIFLILNKINSLNYFDSNSATISFIILSFGFYLTGLYDDKYNISPLSRILIMALILFITITLNDLLQIKKLNINFYNKSLFLGNLSILFSIICILIFTYALNMFDGINLQSITYSIFIFLIIIFNTKFYLLSTVIIICLFFLLILNSKNKIFLGDGGVYVLAAIISYIIIYEYNSDNIFFSVDNIFIIMMLPGFDFIKLFIQRIINGKHPFLGDKKHLHHLLANKFKLINVYFIILFLYIFPFILKILGFNSFFIIISFLFFYLYLNFYFLKKFQ